MLRISAYAGLVLVCAAGAAAQVPPPPAQAQALQQVNRQLQLQQIEQDTRLRANPEIPTGERLLLDYGGYVSFDYLSIDDANHNNHGLRQYELVGFIRANLDGAQEFFARARTDYRDYNPGDSFDGFGSRLINPDLDRCYYRFDLQRAQAAYGTGAGPLKMVVEVGRDLDYWANGLVLTEVLDGGRMTLGAGPVDLQLLAGITPTRTVDIDTSRPEFSFNTRRLFYGAMFSAQIENHHPFAYALNQRDENDKDTSALGPFITQYRYDSLYLGFGSEGNLGDRLRYGLEATYERGHTLSTRFIPGTGSLVPVTQFRDAIHAWAMDGRLEYLTQTTYQARFTGELIVASGEHNRGTSSNTFNGVALRATDHGFNGFGLLNTGLAFAPEVSNLVVGRLGASVFPLPQQPAFKRFQIGADFFVFGKLLRNAPIVEATSDQRFLGVEPDIYLNWQIASDVTLALRYGVFFPNRDTFGSGTPGETRQFFFGGLTFAF